MNRRGFLGSILALGAAPAIVRADSLMRIIPREATVLIERIAPMEILPGNHIMTLEEITREALRIAHKQATFISLMSREFDSRFPAARVGEKIKFRRPLA